MLESLRGWRTVLINVAMAWVVLMAELAEYLTIFDWHSVLPAEHVPWAILAVNVANITLRYVTTTPVGQRDGAA